MHKENILREILLIYHTLGINRDEVDDYVSLYTIYDYPYQAGVLNELINNGY